MKKISMILVLLLGSLYASYGQLQDTISDRGLDFMTITAVFPDNSLLLVYITDSDGNYEKINIDDLKLKYKYGETTFILKLLNKYSKEGWNLQNSNMTVDNGNRYLYYLLARKKD